MRVETIISLFVGAVIGGIGGAATGYMVASNRFDKKVAGEVARAIEVTKQQMTQEKAEELVSEYKPETTEEPPKEEEKAENIRETEIKDSSKVVFNPVEKVDYTQYSFKTDDKPEPTPDRKKFDPREPYLITSQEYDDECLHFTKRDSVLYYRQSHVLIDEDRNNLDLDIAENVGYENLSEITKRGTIFVRNEMIGEDFRITLVDGIYYEE